MARELQEAPRSQRLIQLGAVLLASGGAAVAFGRVFVGHAPTLKLVLVAFLSVGLAAAFERRSPLLAAVVSAVGLLWVIGLLVFPHSLWHGLPLGRTVHRIGVSLGRVGRQADVQVAPTPPLRPLFMAAVTAVWTAAFSTHALAVRSGSPLLASIPPAALVGFTGLVLEDGARPAYAALFLVGVLALLFADGLRRVRQWGPVRPWSSGLAEVRRRLVPTSLTRGARRVVVAAMGVALLLPGLLPGFGAKPVLHIGAAAGGSAAIDPLVAVSNSLRRDRPVSLFTVRTSADTGVYWRWLALDEFDGDRWTARDVRVEHDPTYASGEALPVQATHVPHGTESETVEQTVTIVRSPGIWLPMAYEPESIDLGGGSVRFDRQHTSAVLVGDIEPGFTYHVTSRVLEPTFQQLNQRFDYSGSRYGPYTELPSDLPPVIGHIAREIVRQARARTPLTEAIAIQDYLTSPQVGFQYDASIPRGDGSSALVDFLTRTQRGFCQQFASAMAVLLRTLHIPARVAVGFTQGTYDAGLRAFDVTTENAHTWVEVLFPGYGWLPFEPTPTRSNPVTEQITDPTRGEHGSTPTTPGTTNREGSGTGGGSVGGHKDPQFSSDPLGPPAKPGPSHPIDFVPQPRDVPGPPVSLRVVVLLVLGGLVVAAAVLFPIVKVAVRRIRTARARSARDKALAAFRLFESRAGDVGLGRWPGETPEEYRSRLSRQIRASDGHLDRLTRIAGMAAYARRDVTDVDAAKAGRAGRTAIRDVRRSVPVTRRVAALWRPRI
jgi:transglutaminase-like putative cysteine protease